ncbi:thioredoxin transmembrane protein 2 [Trichuris trichiura]|uniref:Thioredoxin transmembrane protein 2 n=1 Tax=Trichuris trichiura TaxID=36087 RepID=A0A077Z912_TRITR|nr:thioredoxin transmembrane protein 2 [Trichuris trichiura]
MSELSEKGHIGKGNRLKCKALVEVKRICTMHHLMNAFLCAAFYVSKVVPSICHFVYGIGTKCKISEHEYQILLFLAFVIYTKNRKAIIVVCCVFPEPVFNGPEAVLYFRGSNPMQEISQQKGTVWLIEFYANWSSACKHFAPIFADLSLKYALPNLKFGKLDVGRYPQEAQRLTTLPTVILFRDGKEVKRVPVADSYGRVLPYHFTEENVIRDFDLNNVYLHCTRQMKGDVTNEKRRPKVD